MTMHDTPEAPTPCGSNRTTAANLYPPRQGARSERPGRRPKFTEAQIAEALHHGAGIFAEACRVLKAKHGRSLSISGLGRIVNSSDHLLKVLNEVVEGRLDYCESVLWRKIEAGDGRATEFYLRTKGATRGYATNIKHSGDRDNPVRTKVDFDFDAIPVDQLRLIQMALSSARVASTSTADGEPAS
jgi:hypothetical protein